MVPFLQISKRADDYGSIRARGTRTALRVEEEASTSSSKPYHLVQSALCAFMSAGKLREVEANAVLFRQGQATEGAYFLEKGMVKSVVLTPSGITHIVDVHFAKSLLGVESSISRLPARFSVVTLAHSRVRFIPTVELDTALGSTPELTRDLLVVLSEESHALMDSMILLGTANARLRLISLIRKFAEREGVLLQNGDVRVHPCLKFWEIADMLAITPSYLSRLLREFEKSHWLSRKDGWLMLHDATTWIDADLTRIEIQGFLKGEEKTWRRRKIDSISQ